MKKRNWIKLIVTVIVLAIIALLIYMRRRPSGSWGTGKLDSSERSYYSNRIRNVIEKWLQSRSDTENYDSNDVHHPDSENVKMYELAWRIVLPELADAATPEILVEGAVPPEGKQTRSIRDRYGNSIIKNFYGAVYGFEKTRKQTTLKLGVKLNADPYQRVVFQDISLIPGQNQGFKVVMEN